MSLLPASSIGDESTGFYPETVNQSLRFNEGDTPYLSRTFVTPSSTRKIIIATWIKPSELGDETPIMYSSSSNTQNYFLMGFAADGFISATDNFNLFTVEGNSLRFGFRTERLFRDPTNWMHVCVAIDTTQATSTDRVVLFFNGKRYTGSYSSYNTQPSENRDFTILNSAIEHRIGAYSNANHAYGNLDGYLSEFYFIDGQSIFSDTSATANSTFINSDKDTLVTFCEQKNGVAVPKKYSGTFGNNGCRLTFEATGTGTTSQGTTAQTNIGDDQSGQGHNFSVNGLATADVVKDSPTNNFCVLNPLGKQSASALSEGGLKTIITSGTNSGRTPGTFAVNSGKWYWEVRQSSSNRFGMGVFDTEKYVMANEDGGVDQYEWVHVTSDNSGAGQLVNNSNYTNSYGGTAADGHVIMVALDVDNGAIWFGKQGTWYNKGTSDDSATVKGQIEAGTTTNAAFTSVTGRLTPSFIRQTSNNTINVNFGQDDTFAGNETTAGNTDSNGNGSFQYEPPSGFLALCSDNLPDLAISPAQSSQADDHFNTITYTGNDASSRALTGVGFQPDWIWYKHRSIAYGHVTYDSSRGTGENHLRIDDTLVEGDYNDLYGTLTSFDADGITVARGDASGTESAFFNTNSQTVVGWNWKANGSTTTSHSSGDNSANHASVSQANQTAGFSIVTYTGDVSGNPTKMNHGLGKTPRMIIVKSRSASGSWAVYHEDTNTGSSYNHALFLNSNNARTSANNAYWGSDTMVLNDNLFSVNNSTETNTNSVTYVAYLFAEIEGYSKFGKYIGNNSTDGTFVYTGFRPAWVMVKYASGSGEDWIIWDNKRDTDNLVHNKLYANAAGTEITDTVNRMMDFLSNGFKHRTDHVSTNGNGGTYIYMAFAEQPFKFSNAR